MLKTDHVHFTERLAMPGPRLPIVVLVLLPTDGCGNRQNDHADGRPCVCMNNVGCDAPMPRGSLRQLDVPNGIEKEAFMGKKAWSDTEPGIAACLGLACRGLGTLSPST